MSYLIESPEGAEVQVVQEIDDPQIPNGAIIMTIHRMNDQGLRASNVWFRVDDEHRRITREKLVSADMVNDFGLLAIIRQELNRWVASNEHAIQNDPHLNRTVKGLRTKIVCMEYEAMKNSQTKPVHRYVQVPRHRLRHKKEHKMVRLGLQVRR